MFVQVPVQRAVGALDAAGGDPRSPQRRRRAPKVEAPDLRHGRFDPPWQVRVFDRRFDRRFDRMFCAAPFQSMCLERHWLDVPASFRGKPTLFDTGHNYTGRNYTGRNYTGRNYTGHSHMALHSYGSQEELVAQTVRAGGNSCGPIIAMALYSYGPI